MASVTLRLTLMLLGVPREAAPDNGGTESGTFLGAWQVPRLPNGPTDAAPRAYRVPKTRS